ncbi:hypothetical protein HPB48_011917 [Haemaphysalis longicornis]|uniref:F-box domain-containing protein n=1 Tax=Haemaphysalis longicornis TaxID=44386 RepID=A0A9J6FNX3_HAELO|nr:hypothetical protein HPB48_011917 [Haemaphysalis longicornis]
MAVALRNYDYSRLPYGVWLRILSFLDTDALLTIEATASCFTDIVRDDHLLSSIVCAPSSDEKTLQRFFTTRVTHNVKVLDVSNCIVAAPNIILYWVGTCTTLAELRCVNCPLPYSDFLMIVMGWLPCLQRLDWSFFGKDLNDDDMWSFMAQYNEWVIPQLRSTYVEVACQGADNYALLIFLLKRCIALQKLHLHALHSDFTEATAMCIGAATLAMASAPTLVYSTGLDALPSQLPFFTSVYLPLLQVPSNITNGATVCGNLVYFTASTAGGSCSHTDATPPPVEPPHFKQLVVALSNGVGGAYRLSEAVSGMTWTHIEALKLVLLPEDASDTATCAGTIFRDPLIKFLQSFQAMTELNMNSFHFLGGVDCCSILAAVPMRLRALSIAPCGINRYRSFKNLAKVSSKLEELDVRMNSDNVSLHCALCSQYFRIMGSDAAILQQRSSLRRFTFSNVLKVESLSFIAQLRPFELRLSLMADLSTITLTRYLLTCNDNLRSLVLRDRALCRGLEFYQRKLDALSGLNHLSLDVSAPSDHEKVRSFFNHMTARLPVLETLHLHYVSGDNLVRTLTWFRQRAWHRKTSQGDGQPPGVLLADRPCIGCSMATFIGLAKPRHQRQNCL